MVSYKGDLYKLLLVQVMAALVISISSDSSEESVGSHAPRVILFGTIPTSIPVIPMVHAKVPIALDDPIVALEKNSLPVAPELQLVSPFLCSDDSKADSESEPAEQRPEMHESLTPSSEFPLAHVVTPLGIRRRQAILVRPGEAIPFGRPYRTHPNGPHKLLTARKRVGPFPAPRLAWRRVSHRSLDRHSSPDFTLDSSSSSSSSDSSSDISSGSSSDSLSDSSSVHSSGQSAPLSTLYPPTTSESSIDSSSERSLDSSSPSAGLSRKRCRSLAILVPSSTLVLRLIAPALADLLPRKRFRDSYSSKGVGAHTEDGIDLGVEVATSDIREDQVEFEAEASAGDTMEITIDPLATGDIFEPTGGDAPHLEVTFYDISHYMSEVPLDRIIEFETAQRQLEAGQLEASKERELV
ncbi:hypothetical protein Tco_1273184 [Tanacetum coccineum]